MVLLIFGVVSDVMTTVITTVVVVADIIATMVLFSTGNIQTAKKMHCQFRIELVKHMLSNA